MTDCARRVFGEKIAITPTIKYLVGLPVNNRYEILLPFRVFFPAMKVRQIRWLLFTVLPILLALDFVTSPSVVGVSQEWSKDQYRFVGGTGPLGLVIAALVLCMYLLLMHAEEAEIRLPFPGVFRRFVAFWLDFVVAMTMVAPVLGVIVALSEWRRTGVFQWAFERETTRLLMKRSLGRESY
jgi:hypothetical protein